MLFIGALTGPAFELDELDEEFGYLGVDVLRPDKALLLVLLVGLPPDPTPIPTPLLFEVEEAFIAFASQVSIPRPLKIKSL
jgi:hypothetical protein